MIFVLLWTFFQCLACSLVDKEETRRFSFLAESLSDFGLKTFMCANTN